MSAPVRAAAMRHLVTIRERLSKTYRDDVLWNAIESLDEALQSDPIEAERAAIVDMLLDEADAIESERGDPDGIVMAKALVEFADKVRARDGHTADAPSPSRWAKGERQALVEASTPVPTCSVPNCSVCTTGTPNPPPTSRGETT